MMGLSSGHSGFPQLCCCAIDINSVFVCIYYSYVHVFADRGHASLGRV